MGQVLSKSSISYKTYSKIVKRIYLVILVYFFGFLSPVLAADATVLMNNTKIREYVANEKPLREVLRDMTFLVKETYPAEREFCIRIRPSSSEALENQEVTFEVRDCSVLLVLRLLCHQIPDLGGVPPVKIHPGEALLWRQVEDEVQIWVDERAENAKPEPYSLELVKKAEAGDAKAQCALGSFHYFGDGVAKDEKEAVKWYAKAAEQGDPEAQCNLGFCYANGRGVIKDYKEAVKWWTKSAEQGHAKAQFNLGMSYNLGEGVTKDYKEAVKWWTKSAEQGYESAQLNLGNCCYNGQGIAEDDNEAVKWWAQSAEQGNAIAQCKLGNSFSGGHGVIKDEKKAVKWYIKSAEQGEARAQCELGFCYANGEGVTKDEKEAVKWWTKAADQGDALAKKALIPYHNTDKP